MRRICTLLVFLAVIVGLVLPAAGGHSGLHQSPPTDLAAASHHAHDAEPVQAATDGHDHGGLPAGDCEAVAGHCIVFLRPMALSVEFLRLPTASRHAIHGDGLSPDRVHDTETPPPRA